MGVAGASAGVAAGVADVFAAGVAATFAFCAAGFLFDPHEAGAVAPSVSAAQTMTTVVLNFISRSPFGNAAADPLLQNLCGTPRTERTVSRAMSSSSSVGMT